MAFGYQCAHSYTAHRVHSCWGRSALKARDLTEFGVVLLSVGLAWDSLTHRTAQAHMSL